MYRSDESDDEDCPDAPPDAGSIGSSVLGSGSHHSGSTVGPPPAGSPHVPHSGSGNSSKAPSLENNNKHSFDTVSLGSVISVPPALHRVPSLKQQHSNLSPQRYHNQQSSSPRSESPALPSITAQHEERDSEENIQRRIRLQLYVFVLRCIAFTFNAKDSSESSCRHTKVSKQDLVRIKDRFEQFLRGALQEVIGDEAFKNVVQSYYETFLKSDRVVSMVKGAGCSENDLRQLFRSYILKSVNNLPVIDGLSKETVLASWMTEFDKIYRGDEDPRKIAKAMEHVAGEVIIKKEQLYEMFQNILGITKREHAILFNSMQLDNPDEQAAQVRRELESRMDLCKQRRMGRGERMEFLKQTDKAYFDEVEAEINQLMTNLERMGAAGNKEKPKKTKTATSIPVRDDNDVLTKADVRLQFKVEVVVMEVRGLTQSGTKRIFCTMEMDGNDKLQTGVTEVSKPSWQRQGDFSTTNPLPIVKVKLYLETSGTFSIDDKELGRVHIKPKINSSRQPEWYLLSGSGGTGKGSSGKPQQQLKIKICVKMEKPENLKHQGYLYALGRTCWKKPKRRYFTLIQVSQFCFALCSHHPDKKGETREILQLNGYTVDYCDIHPELEGGKYFFSLVKEGDNLVLSTDEEKEREVWVQSVYRATGQSHKPTAPAAHAVNGNSSGTMSATNATGAPGVIPEEARRTGLDEFISMKPTDTDHMEMFRELQHVTLVYRMNGAYTCLGALSPGQQYVLDEYGMRYGVRGFFRHYCYLTELLDLSESEIMVDATLLHYSFAFCSSHIFGNRPDGFSAITTRELKAFEDIKQRLHEYVEEQITRFRYSFPFGRPEGALKSTLSLLEQIMKRDMRTPVTPEELSSVLRDYLRKAALLNYTQLSKFAKIEEFYESESDPEKILAEITRLSKLCIEVQQQNEEFHADAFHWYRPLMNEHHELFWSLFEVDIDRCIRMQPPDSWSSFSLFQLLNNFFLDNSNHLRGGKFHTHLGALFAPMVVRYVDMMEGSMGQVISSGFSRERWEAEGAGCATSVDVVWKLEALQKFIRNLRWPEEVFAEHLDHRLRVMATDMIEASGNRTAQAFDAYLQKGSRSTDYIVSRNLCIMANTVIDLKAQCMRLCPVNPNNKQTYHTKIEDFLDQVIAHMSSSFCSRFIIVLDTILAKLKRYDERSFLSPFFSLGKPTDELGKEYVSFVEWNLDMIGNKVNDEIFVHSFFVRWFSAQLTKLNGWLAERDSHSLHTYQLTCAVYIFKKCTSAFQLQGVGDDVMRGGLFETVFKRLQIEETTHSVNDGRPIRQIDGRTTDGVAGDF